MRKIKSCNVAVIGGAGFLGSHLVDHLIEDRECSVLVLDNLIVGQQDFIHPRAKFLWHDITHSEASTRKIFEHIGVLEGLINAHPSVWDDLIKPVIYKHKNKSYGYLNNIDRLWSAGVVMESMDDIDFITNLAGMDIVSSSDILDVSFIEKVLSLSDQERQELISVRDQELRKISERIPSLWLC